MPLTIDNDNDENITMGNASSTAGVAALANPGTEAATLFSAGGELAFMESNHEISSSAYGNLGVQSFAGSLWNAETDVDVGSDKPSDDQCTAVSDYLRPISPTSSIASILASWDLDELGCPVSDCRATFTGTYRHRSLTRHMGLRHRKGPISSFSCRLEGCTMEYKRYDALRRHQRKKHSKSDATRASLLLFRGAHEKSDSGSHKVQPEPLPEVTDKFQPRPQELLPTSPIFKAENLVDEGNAVEIPHNQSSAFQSPYGQHLGSSNPLRGGEATSESTGDSVISRRLVATSNRVADSATRMYSRPKESANDLITSAGPKKNDRPEVNNLGNSKLASIFATGFSCAKPLEASSPTDYAEYLRAAGQDEEQLLGQVTSKTEDYIVPPPLWSDTSLYNYNDQTGFNDNSPPGSYANSVFSALTKASSMTDLSSQTQYSQYQIARATKELKTILGDDEELAPLYRRAIDDPSIGSVRLERNLRRLFKLCANALKQEAGDFVQYQTSRLVLLKAREVAQCIVRQYDDRPTLTPAPKRQVQSPPEDSDEEPEELEEPPVDESIFSDLVLFREFLVGSDSLSTLRASVKSFIIPKPAAMCVDPSPITIIATPTPSIPPDGVTVLKLTSDSCQEDIWCWKIYNKMLKTAQTVLVTMEFLEPPLRQGYTRLRWQCSCGDSLYGDVYEYREGGVASMVERMQHSIGTNVVRSTTASQKYTFSAPGWIKRGTLNLTSMFSGTEKRTPCLPKHNPACNNAMAVSTNANQVPTQTLHLLACMQRGRLRTILDQSRVDSIKTDQELFCHMKERLSKKRGLVRRFLSLKCVKGLFFVKFRLRSCNSAEIRDHEPCCTTSARQICDCIPPAAKVIPPDPEYECDPAGPLDTYPPVMPKEMLHMLSHPELIDVNETFVLKQLPKRTLGELRGQVGKPVEGWGIQYREGWDWDILIGIVSVVFFSASLLFAVLWTHFKYDLQGAIGVSSYMVTVMGILLACIVNRAGKFG